MVAAVYVVAKFMYNVRFLQYKFLRNLFVLYGGCCVCCCEMYIYCTVAAVYAVAKFMYAVQ